MKVGLVATEKNPSLMDPVRHSLRAIKTSKSTFVNVSLSGSVSLMLCSET